MVELSRLSKSIVLKICTLLFLLCLLSGCGREKDPHGGTLVLSALTEIETLNPLFYRGTDAVHIANMLFNSLVKPDEQLQLIPDLAESWQVSEDGLVWDFHLREDVRFHDGAELTAQDVVFTFTAIMNPELESPYRSPYKIIENFEVTGEYTFQIRLRESYAPLLNLLLFPILPAHSLKTDQASHTEFGRRPIGTGPYRFFGWGNGELTLSANTNYFAGKPFIETVIVHSFADKRLAWAALMQGKTDMVPDLVFEDFKIIEHDPRFRVYSYPSFFYYTILFNLEEGLFSLKEVRQAIDLSIDRTDIIDKALSGGGIIATGPFQPQTWPFNPEVPDPRYDPERAIALLKELGWQDRDHDYILDKEGQKFKITLLIDQGNILKEVAAQRIKWQLFQVGIRVDVEFVPLQELFQEHLIPGNFQAVLIEFNAGIEPDKYISAFWHSDSIGEWNFARYHNDRMDSLIERGRVIADFTERQKIYREIHSIIARDKPAVFLFFRNNFVGISAKWEGINPAPQSFYRLIKDWYLVEKE